MAGMNKFLIMLLMAIAILLWSVPGQAIELSDNFNLDGYTKILYALEDADSKHIDTDTRRIQLDVNTTFVFETEIGVTVADLVRVSGNYGQVEDLEEEYGISTELYLSKLFKLPVNIGAVFEVQWEKDLQLNDEELKCVCAGLVARFQ